MTRVAKVARRMVVFMFAIWMTEKEEDRLQCYKNFE